MYMYMYMYTCWRKCMSKCFCSLSIPPSSEQPACIPNTIVFVNCYSPMHTVCLKFPCGCSFRATFIITITFQKGGCWVYIKCLWTGLRFLFHSSGDCPFIASRPSPNLVLSFYNVVIMSILMHVHNYRMYMYIHVYTCNCIYSTWS